MLRRLKVYSVLVVTAEGKRFEQEHAARAASDAVRAAKREVSRAGYRVAWAVWNGAREVWE